MIDNIIQVQCHESAFKMQCLLSFSNSNSKQANNGLTRNAGEGRSARHHKHYWFFLSVKAFKGIPTKTHAMWNRTLCSVNLAGQWKEDTDWKSQTNGETFGVNKSEARLLPNCFVGNCKNMVTIPLHFSNVPYMGDVISPSLFKRLQRDAEITPGCYALKVFRHCGYGQSCS